MASRLIEREPSYPEAYPAAPRLADMLHDADAALVIGDPALRIDPDTPGVLDLANEWRSHTGLPFVFAFWAARPEVVTPELAADFATSLANGLEHLDEIADRTASQLDLDRRDLVRYLRENLRFELGRRELQAIEEFYQRAHRHGLIDRPRRLSLAS